MIKNILCIILLLSISLCAQSESFIEFSVLNPDINILDEKYTSSTNRLIFLCDGEYFYSWNVNENVLKKLSEDECNVSVEVLRDRYPYDTYTQSSYYYLDFNNEIPFKSGWYKPILTKEGKLAFEGESSYFPDKGIKINNNSTLKRKSSDYNNTVTYSIVTENNDEVWNRIYENSFFDSINYISDSWLFADKWLVSGSTNVFNYETGEELSFAPEKIIGYGNGVILTSEQTNFLRNIDSSTYEEREYIGIIVQSPEKEILYQDRKFAFTKPLLENLTEEWMRMHYLSYNISYARFEYPYIFCEAVVSIGIYKKVFTIILNLETDTTYLSPENFSIVGIFEIEEK